MASQRYKCDMAKKNTKRGPAMSTRKCKLGCGRLVAKRNGTGVCYLCQQHRWGDLGRKDPRPWKARKPYMKAWRMAKRIRAAKAKPAKTKATRAKKAA